MKNILSKIIPLLYGQYLNFLVLFSKKRTAQTAFDIFCTVRKGRVKDLQKDFLNSAKYSTEEVLGQHIQSYRWQGTKPTVLLLHGWESNTYRWRNLIKKLREHDFEVLAFDAPGHGYSTGKKLHVPLYANTTRHFLDKFKPTYVVAHSVGGMTILYDHYKNPDSSVDKIVTIGSPCEFSDIMAHFQDILKFNDKVMKAMDTYVKKWFGLHIHEFSSAHFVANNYKKGLLFHDEDDAQIAFGASKKVHKHWKGSQFIGTKGLGHSMHQEQVNNQIIEFLEGV
ncbi:MAG: alpha/beta hydrolase [Croceitalea sp.]|nr:alpha/beta hydrolase [Croceitalea sp.]NNL09016.1 alpha/beta hydrolase [Croceitalea sp.]NNM18743.1 alpha/beta hydrolase [Croceitalea sp.]